MGLGATAIKETMPNRGLASHSLESILPPACRTGGAAHPDSKRTNAGLGPHFGEKILRCTRTLVADPKWDFAAIVGGACARGRALVCGYPCVRPSVVTVFREHISNSKVCGRKERRSHARRPLSSLNLRTHLEMKIAQIAPLMESVPPKLYGGTERIVSYLTEELVRQGHEVTLFASGDSRTSAELVACCDASLRLSPKGRDPVPCHVSMLEQVRRWAEAFDVLHFHVDVLHFPIIREFSRRTVTTLHGRLDLPDLARLYAMFDDIPLVSISDDQRRPMPPVNWLGTVYHGLPPGILPFRQKASSYLAFLGRISPEKGPLAAIEIAARAGMPLKIAAKIDSVDRSFWRECVEPQVLRNSNVEFIGEINERQKAEFLGKAAALLFPIDWPEPFGLVTIEAMACGTPVSSVINDNRPRPC